MSLAVGIDVIYWLQVPGFGVLRHSDIQMEYRLNKDSANIDRQSAWAGSYADTRSMQMIMLHYQQNTFRFGLIRYDK